MKILLDENFPIQLYRRLNEAGHDAEHIITLGLRGVSDDEIRRRLATETDLRSSPRTPSSSNCRSARPPSS